VNRPVRSALIAYAAAFALMSSTSTVLVLGVALARASGDVAHVRDQAAGFSLSAAGLMSVACANAVVLLAVAFVVAGRAGDARARTLRLSPTQATGAGVAAAVVGMVGLSAACAAASELAGAATDGVMERVARALERPSPAGLLLALVTIGLAPGFAEETFFRGLLQPLLASDWGRWPSIVATSLGFGIMHGDLVQGTLTLVAGVFLGWTADRLGGVRPTIAAHAVNNSLFVVLASMGSTGPGSHRVLVTVCAIGATACMASVAVLHGRAAVRP